MDSQARFCSKICGAGTWEPNEYPWQHGQVWAEPDVGAAARIMRDIFNAPESALKRAAAGQVLVQDKYGLAAVGRAMHARFVELMKI